MARIREVPPADRLPIEEDRAWHRDKVLESLSREDLKQLLEEIDIITADREKRVKVNLRAIKEYQMRFKDENQQAGQYPGKERGQKITKVGSDISEEGPLGAGAGNDPGDDIYETNVLIREILERLRDDLELPRLKDLKADDIVKIRKRRFRGTRRQGILARWHRIGTAKERVKDWIVSQGAATAPLDEFPFELEHLRFRKRVSSPDPRLNAVVFFVMDTSGSMTKPKIEIIKQLFSYLVDWIKSRPEYDSVKFVFIVHDTESKEVPEELFFKKSGSGGTHMSSGMRLELEMIERDFNPDQWNIYSFYASDGDNDQKDNERALVFADRVSEISNLFGYFQIQYPQGKFFDTLEPTVKKSRTLKRFKIQDERELKGVIEELLSRGG